MENDTNAAILPYKWSVKALESPYKQERMDRTSLGSSTHTRTAEFSRRNKYLS